MSSPPPAFPLPPSLPLMSSLNSSMPIQSSLNHVDSPSPYFPLPNPALLDETDTYTPPPRSIQQIYGKVEHMSDRKQADFLLRLMAHSNMKPDFDAMASSIGLGNESAVKQRFKSLCEVNKFKYEDESNCLSATDDLPRFDKSTLEGFVEQGVDGLEEDVKPAAPKRKRTYKRKPKVEQAKTEDADDEDTAEPGPAKKPKVTKGKIEGKPAASKTPKKTRKAPPKTTKAIKTTKPTTKKKPAATKKTLSAERIIDSDEESDVPAVGKKAGVDDAEATDVDEVGAGMTESGPGKTFPSAAGSNNGGPSEVASVDGEAAGADLGGLGTSTAADGPAAVGNGDVAAGVDTDEQ